MQATEIGTIKQVGLRGGICSNQEGFAVICKWAGQDFRLNARWRDLQLYASGRDLKHYECWRDLQWDIANNLYKSPRIQ